jgi:hypothetical protein
MKQVAEDVWRLKEFPAPSINVYCAGDVLIDAGSTRLATPAARSSSSATPTEWHSAVT